MITVTGSKSTLIFLLAHLIFSLHCLNKIDTHITYMTDLPVSDNRTAKCFVQLVLSSVFTSPLYFASIPHECLSFSENKNESTKIIYTCPLTCKGALKATSHLRVMVGPLQRVYLQNLL